MTQEFDDIQGKPGWRTSSKALKAIRTLASTHHLSFTYNPGGGEFYQAAGSPHTLPPGFRCQISTYDDIDDLECLRKAIAAALAPK